MFAVCRSQSAGRLSDMLLKAAFGPGRVGGDNLSTGTPAPQTGHAHFPSKLSWL